MVELNDYEKSSHLDLLGRQLHNENSISRLMYLIIYPYLLLNISNFFQGVT